MRLLQARYANEGCTTLRGSAAGCSAVCTRQQARHPLVPLPSPPSAAGTALAGAVSSGCRQKAHTQKAQVMDCCLHMIVHQLQAPYSAIQRQLDGCRQLTSRCWWLHTWGSPGQRSLGSGIGQVLVAATGRQEARSWSVDWLPAPPAAISCLPPCKQADRWPTAKLTSWLACCRHSKLLHAPTAAEYCSASCRCSGVCVSSTLREAAVSTRGMGSVFSVRQLASCSSKGVNGVEQPRGRSRRGKPLQGVRQGCRQGRRQCQCCGSALAAPLCSSCPQLYPGRCVCRGWAGELPPSMGTHPGNDCANSTRTIATSSMSGQCHLSTLQAGGRQGG